MKSLLAAALLAGISRAALAGDPPVHVPALDPAAIKTAAADPSTGSGEPAIRMPPPIQTMRPSALLDRRERRAVILSRRWRYAPHWPHPGPDGVVRYVYGAALPSIVCAPERECDLALQPGEVVEGITVGDKIDWAITPQMSGPPAARTTHVQIRPLDAGLVTNMIITTDRRTYAIKLISVRVDYMPLVAFSYPEDQAAAWNAYQQQIGADPPGTPTSAGNIYLPYQVTGPAVSFYPLRVWSNGEKTWLLFAPGFQHYQAGAPVLEAITGGCGLCVFRSAPTAVLNTRWDGNYLVYDGVLDHAELVAGNQSVRIDRVGAP